MKLSKIKEQILHGEEDGIPLSKGDIPEVLGMIPLKDTVVFPYTVVSLFVYESRSIKAVEEALQGDRILAVVAVREEVEKKDSIGPEDLYSVGTVVLIHK